jgi:hypothetical protein
LRLIFGDPWGFESAMLHLEKVASLGPAPGCCLAVVGIERWVAGYPRVSTDMQMERDSLENQVQALTAYGTARGVSLRLYREEGVSAKDTERPALMFSRS